MIPQYIRVVLPSNKNVQVLVPSQQSLLQYPSSSTPRQIHLVGPTASAPPSSSAVPSLRSDIVPSSASSPSIVNEQATQKAYLLMSQMSSCQIPSLSSAGAAVAPKENIIETNLMSDIAGGGGFGNTVSSLSLPTSVKRHRSSSSSNKNKSFAKKSITIKENDNYYQRKIKRAKNWTEEETSVFIGVWCEYYDSLMKAGSRNSPIYHSMADQLNQLLSPRVMSAADVRSKIFNLVAEYRKKKKDQGKTGGSPSSWRYFDQIDKLLGERPYNDDSLLSDSMSIQEDELLDDIENAQLNDSNTHLLIEDDDQISTLLKEIEEKTKENHSSSLNPSSTNNSSCVLKNTTQHTTDSSTKKCPLSKKKKISDMCIDLMQQILVKIDGVNEMANRSEPQALALLEKQTKLQEESLNNEKEFLNMFRSIANNLNQIR